MVGISEIQIPATVRFLQQDADNLLPYAAALIFEQAPVAGFGRGRDVVGQVFPLTPGFEHVQDAIENFPFVGPGPPGSRAFRQQGIQIIPLAVCDIRPIRLPWGRRNIE